jgi:hemerythrin-like domain-containing protein
MKATLLLRKDHETILSMLSQFNNGNRKDKDALFAEIRRELEWHTRVEEELLYPELQNSISPEAAEIAARAVADHEGIDAIIGELAALGPQNKQFAARMQALTECLQKHIAFEEDEVFEEARKTLSEYRLEELGLEMEDRRRFLQISAA